MANAARNFVTGLAFTVSLATTGQALAAEDGQATIVIHLDDFFRVPRADLLAAEAEVTRIYAAAGVRTMWAAGNEPADTPGLHVRVQLLSGHMAMLKIRRERLAESIVGRAAREAGRAYIFTHRIASLALLHGDDFRELLGRVIAHEVGHLVLPIYSHSDRGIMRADMVLHSKHASGFTTEQGVAIRSMLLASADSTCMCREPFGFARRA